MIHDSEAKADNIDYGLRLGAYGWRHSNWLTHYYPDDLPEDWQLGFYANEFSAIMVPASYWSDGLDVENWCEDISPRFRFYLEYPTDVDANTFRQQCIRMGDALGGVILESDSDIDVPCPVYLHKSSSQAVQLLKADLDAAPDIAIIQLGTADLRQQRAWLDQLHLQSNSLGVILLRDPELGIDRLQSFKTLIELMGF